jgi:hypothetical protein
MIGGVSPETCWASRKYEIKFWYTVASCWIFFVNYTMMQGATNIKWTCLCLFYFPRSSRRAMILGRFTGFAPFVFLETVTRRWEKYVALVRRYWMGNGGKTECCMIFLSKTLFQSSVPASHKLCISVTKISHWVVFREMVAVYSENHAKFINVLCWKKSRVCAREGKGDYLHCIETTKL